MNYQSLTDSQVDKLEARGNTADKWEGILVTSDFCVESVRNVHFIGDVTIGNTSGVIVD